MLFRSLQANDLSRAVRNMVPLSVTQSEQIASVRAWATVRAVAATATEDRSGYETAVVTEPALPRMPGGAMAGAMSRGGRVVDF